MNADTTLIDFLAASLREAAATGRPLPPMRETLAHLGVAGAYAVQQTNTRFAIATGRRVVGHKIGLTSRAMQLSSQIDEPDYAPLMDDMFFAQGGDIAVPPFINQSTSQDGR